MTFEGRVRVGLGVDAVTPLELMLILAEMVTLGMLAVVVFHTARTRSNMADLVEGIAQGLGHLSSRMETVEQIPEILKEIGVGGVQLMPQKTLGESIMEHVVGKWFNSNSIIDPPKSETPWPDAAQPESPVLESVSED